MKKQSLVWVVPEERGGIRTYSEALCRAVKTDACMQGWITHDPLYAPFDSVASILKSVHELKAIAPTVIHLQHEYGLFNNKLPGFYLFPRWIKEVRAVLPETKVFATAHNVLDPQYFFPVHGSGWQAPLRLLANALFMDYCRNLWSQQTWGKLDGVFVHSQFQKPWVESSGCPKVEVIPHFVPQLMKGEFLEDANLDENRSQKNILVFGFFSPDKGQDIAIRAMEYLPENYRLTLAGGARRPKDETYLSECKKILAKKGLADRVQITGFVDPADIDTFYKKADLVLAPFRETSGSGSLVQALGRGLPILASDLPLNLEISTRVSGALAYFKSEDSKQCAIEIMKNLESVEAVRRLRVSAAEYSNKYSSDNLAKNYLGNYS